MLTSEEPSRYMTKYSQIAEDIRRKISSGSLPAGARLPIREELMAEYKVTRTTLDRALGTLIQEGLLEASRRRGTFVSDYHGTDKIAVISWLDSILLHTSTWENPYDYYALFHGLIQNIPEHRLEFIVPTEVTRNINQLRQFGRILWCNLTADDFEQAVAAVGDRQRFLVINRYYDRCNYISTNHRQAAFELTEHFLANLPDAQIYYLDLKQELPSARFVEEERLKGFIDCCEKFGRFYRLLNSRKKDYDFNLSNLENNIKAATGKPIILISPSKDSLGAVLGFMRRRNLELNRNLFYGDFDNTDSLNTYGLELTSVLQDFRLISQLAVQSLNIPEVQMMVPHRIVNAPFTTHLQQQ